METKNGRIINLKHINVVVKFKDLSHSLFLDMALISDSIVSHCNFKNLTIAASKFETTRFDNCIFDNCCFNGCTIRMCTFTDCSFQNTDFSDSTVTASNITKSNITNLKGIDTSNVKFIPPNLINPLIREEVGNIDPSVPYDKFTVNFQLGPRMNRVSGLIATSNDVVVNNTIIIDTSKKKPEGSLIKTCFDKINKIRSTIAGNRNASHRHNRYTSQRSVPTTPAVSSAAHIYFSDESVFTKGNNK